MDVSQYLHFWKYLLPAMFIGMYIFFQKNNLEFFLNIA